MYRYIEHVTHMCLRSWSVLYSDHLNLEIPVDIKKKYSVSKVQDVHVVSVSLSVNGDSYWKEQLFDIIVCVTWSWHYFADDRNCDCSLCIQISVTLYTPKIKAHRTHLSKKLRRDMYMYACTFIIFEFIGWKTRGFLKISVPLFRDIFPPKSRCGH